MMGAPPAGQDDDLRAFLLVLRRALLLIVGYIDERYGLDQSWRKERAERRS